MSADALGRRIAVQERIERAKHLLAHAEEATRGLTFGDDTLDTLDTDGHVRRALRALLPVAVNAVGFDVVIGLGTDPAWGVRIYHEGDSVEVAAVTLCHRAASAVQVDATQVPDADDANPDADDLDEGAADPAAGPDNDTPEQPDDPDDVVSQLADLLRG